MSSRVGQLPIDSRHLVRPSSLLDSVMRGAVAFPANSPLGKYETQIHLVSSISGPVAVCIEEVRRPRKFHGHPHLRYQSAPRRLHCRRERQLRLVGAIRGHTWSHSRWWLLLSDNRLLIAGDFLPCFRNIRGNVTVNSIKQILDRHWSWYNEYLFFVFSEVLASSINPISVVDEKAGIENLYSLF